MIKMKLIEGENSRYCTKCEKLKRFDKFYKREVAKYGYSSKCKECSRRLDREYYHKNNEHVLDLKRQWREKNPDKVKEIKANFDDRHRERLKKEAREYYANNREEIREKENAIQRERWENDINFRLKKYVANATRISLNNGHTSEIVRKYVQCTVSYLKEHLENQFKEGMSWDNFGKEGWNIDHIIPLDSFDLECKYQQKVAFHWSNVQPLWELENREKYTHIVGFENLSINKKFLETHRYV